ncbi:MAG: spermidine/putrescine transporter substrate-binding protein [Enterovirga sp.]|jgi:putative spermidine/putrescine transport system substrate-binding protein|nr:spermidine/putrescine transporter substrate-binding protein [Enterovirga sp.]
MTLSRRTILKSGAATLAAGIASPPIVARADETLTVAAFGGEFQDIFMRTVVQPFEKKFSCKVVYDSSGTHVQNYAKIRASRGSPGFDVAAEMTASQNVLGGKEKVLEMLTEKEVPNIKYQFSKSAQIMPANGIIPYYQYTALVWNKDKIKKPESWLDYWEAQKTYGEEIKGRVLTHGMANFELAAYALLMGAKAKGGNERQMDEAWKLLKGLKPYFGPTVDTSAAAVPYFENGQVWIAPYWSARSVYYIKRGLPLAMTVPKEGTVSLASTSSIPIGAKNKKLAFEFLNFRLEPDIQRDFCLAYNCSPARPDLKDLPADYVEQQVTTEEKMSKLTFPDVEYLANQVRPWTETWQDIMAS